MDNIFYTIDLKYFIVNEQLKSKNEIKEKPLGDFYLTSKNIKIKNGRIECESLNTQEQYIFNDIEIIVNGYYTNDNGYIHMKKIENKLPKGEWIKDARQIKKLGKDKISCLLKNKFGIFIYNELIFNEYNEYENNNGIFFYQNRNDIIKQELSEIEKIPKKIFQTHKNQQYIDSNNILKICQESWKKYTDFEYHFYNNDDCLEFIQKNFHKSVVKAYLKCPLDVMRADLWRYCVIYYYGGIYSDMDTTINIDPNVFIQNNSYLCCSVEFDNIHFCQWTFSAPPKSPILAKIITLSVNRILHLKEIKDEHFIHYLTGPRVFTDGIEQFLQQKKCSIYSKKEYYTIYKNYMIHIFSPFEFHHKIISHFLTGDLKNGWKQERNKILHS
jgi:mannosyltransferase OCH1-like enzyme